MYFMISFSTLGFHRTPVGKGCPRVTVLIITNCCFNRRLLLESRQVQRIDNHLRHLMYYVLLARECLLPLRTFLLNNMEVFQKYSEFHAVNTRQLQMLQSIKRECSMMEHLVPKIKCLSSNSRQFKISLKTVLLIWNFYLADWVLFRVSATSEVIGQITT
jgi:hypothetical protein